jgi:tRNA(fMet)-specific endonuclease VapC
METKQYLLDTNILIEFMNGNPSVVDHVLSVGIDHCCMSVISLHELYFGAYYAKTKKEEYFEKEMKRINKLLERFTVLPLPENADGYGQIKMSLRLAGKLADEFDMIIGGQAQTIGLTVVTDNVKHFELMPEVKVENWMTRL